MDRSPDWLHDLNLAALARSAKRVGLKPALFNVRRASTVRNALGIACVRGAIWHLSFVDALIVSARALLSVKVSPRLEGFASPSVTASFQHVSLAVFGHGGMKRTPAHALAAQALD